MEAMMWMANKGLVDKQLSLDQNMHLFLLIDELPCDNKAWKTFRERERDTHTHKFM